MTSITKAKHGSMRYLSVCSGIEAATVAWHPLGWTPAAFSEIEAFPRAVLAHHYPDVPCHGDFTTISADDYGPIDLLVGGTPCQSFSIAGLRGGLADERGNLALEYLRLADRKRPRWLVWENVPGVLSIDGGRAFGSILGGMAELGYGFAYRILDAKHFGVPQRRRRVFVVGHLGDWRRAAAVLFERQGLSGHPAPTREGGSRIANTLTRGAESSGRGGYAGRRQADDFNVVPVAFGGNNTSGPIDVATALSAHGGPHGRIDFSTETFIVQAFDRRGREGGAQFEGPHDTANIRAASGGSSSSFVAMFSEFWWAVRRLTPTEKERLQGFPDGFTNIAFRGKPAGDGPRSKALGNSMAVPVMRWIGERIAMVEALDLERQAA